MTFHADTRVRALQAHDGHVSLVQHWVQDKGEKDADCFAVLTQCQPAVLAVVEYSTGDLNVPVTQQPIGAALAFDNRSRRHAAWSGLPWGELIIFTAEGVEEKKKLLDFVSQEAKLAGVSGIFRSINLTDTGAAAFFEDEGFAVYSNGEAMPIETPQGITELRPPAGKFWVAGTLL